MNIPFARSLFGVLFCTTLAALGSVASQHLNSKTSLPIWFLLVLLIAIVRYGELVGILGTIFSAVVFATYLFEPLGSFVIKDPDQRNNLMWMVLIGLIASLFGHPETKNATHPLIFFPISIGIGGSLSVLPLLERQSLRPPEQFKHNKT